VPLTTEQREHAELAASRHELSTALTRQVDFLVKQMEMKPDEAAAWVRSGSGIQLDEDADQVSWSALARLLEEEPERGETVWVRIKAQAAKEQETGIRASRTIEEKVHGYPMDRARFMVVLTGLRESLQPRDALEHLLIEQMTSAYELHLLWQDQAARRVQQEEWEADRDRANAIRNMSPREKERYDFDHGWVPPRASTAEAIDQAVLIADRYQRMFLRLLKAFRDMRRLIGTVVLTGGQLNVSSQQIVNPQPTAPSRKCAAVGKTRRRKRGDSATADGDEPTKAG
jgi:hypothetical protein